MNGIIKVGICFLLLGGLMFVTAASLFTYSGDVKTWMVTLGEMAMVLWIPLILMGLFLIGAGVAKDTD